MLAGDRLRRVPPHWWVLGGATALSLAIGVAVLATAGGGSIESVTSQPSTVAPITTDRPAGSTTTTQTTQTAATITPTTLPTATTTSPSSTVPGSEQPAVVARPLPEEPTDDDGAPTTTLTPPPWASVTRTTQSGHVGVQVGCSADLSAAALDRFFADRLGPMIGWDYQHVYPLGGDRYLWLFQDAFVDHSGAARTLDAARFVHNAALLQTGTCFELLHGGTPGKPTPFEIGDGMVDIRSRWFWPMGGEISDGQLWVFWAEMLKDPYDPAPPDGLGWHPAKLYLAAYDQQTLARTAFFAAPDPGVAPIYGYAVSSDTTYTYLFGNTFEQNLVREGGFWAGNHSATTMWLARVPYGQLYARPEYRTADGWSPDRAAAVPISKRFFVENPMQPRFLDGQWVAATKVDGYWGEELVVDVAPDPWGPWTTVERFELQPRGNDPKKNSYHAHLVPWRDGFGSLIVTVSNNARDMLADAYPRPDRYRPMVTWSPYQPTPPPPTTSTTLPPTTTLPPVTTTSTTLPPTTTLHPTTTTSTTTTTLPPTTTTTLDPTTTTTVPA